MTLNLLAFFTCNQFSNLDSDCRFFIAVPISLSDEEQSCLLERIKKSEDKDFLIGINKISDLLDKPFGDMAIYYDLAANILPKSPKVKNISSLSFHTILENNGSIPVHQWFKISDCDLSDKINLMLVMPNNDDFISFLKNDDEKSEAIRNKSEDKSIKPLTPYQLLRKKIIAEDIKLGVVKTQTGYTLGLNDYNRELYLTLEDFSMILSLFEKYMNDVSKRNNKISKTKEFMRKNIDIIMSPENIFVE